MRRTCLLILALVVPVGAAAVYSGLRRYPNRFAEVEASEIYRGGFPAASHLDTLASDKHLRTIVSLTGFEAKPKYVEEQRAAERLGLRLLRYPMPGDGLGAYEVMDRAAEAIGNQENWPVFFHCAAGKQRSNSAQAAYRLKKCGWTVDQALEELERQHGLDPREEAELVEHIRGYAAWLDGGGDADRR